LIAGFRNHTHRWRHTFATTLLSKGILVSEVAAILENSLRIVEKHYSQWISARQEAVNAAVLDNHPNSTLENARRENVAKLFVRKPVICVSSNMLLPSGSVPLFTLATNYFQRDDFLKFALTVLSYR
jgi:hypothetical protein